MHTSDHSWVNSVIVYNSPGQNGHNSVIVYNSPGQNGHNSVIVYNSLVSYWKMSYEEQLTRPKTRRKECLTLVTHVTGNAWSCDASAGTQREKPRSIYAYINTAAGAYICKYIHFTSIQDRLLWVHVSGGLGARGDILIFHNSYIWHEYYHDTLSTLRT